MKGLKRERLGGCKRQWSLPEGVRRGIGRKGGAVAGRRRPILRVHPGGMLFMMVAKSRRLPNGHCHLSSLEKKLEFP